VLTVIYQATYSIVVIAFAWLAKRLVSDRCGDTLDYPERKTYPGNSGRFRKQKISIPFPQVTISSREESGSPRIP